jgi:(2Fe-2S) ferredoxin
MNRRPEGHPRGSCQASGSIPVYDAFKAELEKRELGEQIRVTGTFCLGPCDQGPTAVVYPEGIWYGHLTDQDVNEILDQHLLGGTPVARLVIQP